MTKDRPHIMRWLAMGLALSLAANLFLAGFIVARVATSGQPRLIRDASPAVELSLRSLPQDLPDSVREDLERAFREQRPEIRRAVRQYRDAQEQVRTLLARKDARRAELEEAFRRLRELGAEVQVPMHRVFVTALDNLDPAMRQMTFRLLEPRTPLDISGPARVAGARWEYDLREGTLRLFPEDDEPEEQN